MMSKHTKGPWHLHDSKDSVPYLHIYCSDNMGTMHKSRSDAEKMANARLIAAAPELLEALEAMVSNFGLLDIRECTQEELSAVQAARAVIAKARGEG